MDEAVEQCRKNLAWILRQPKFKDGFANVEDVIDYYKTEKKQQMEIDAYFVYYEFRCYEKSDYRPYDWT